MVPVRGSFRLVRLRAASFGQCHLGRVGQRDDVLTVNLLLYQEFLHGRYNCRGQGSGVRGRWVGGSGDRGMDYIGY